MTDMKPAIVVVGSLNMDIVVEAERQPRMGETITGQNVTLLPGGKGANQAVAAARLGAHTTMIGAVGSDAFGEQLIRSLEQEGIDTDVVRIIPNEVTGTASILLAEGDNCIVVIPGANACCSPDDIDRHIVTLKKADMILIQLEIPMATVRHTIETAHRLGKKVILNPAPAQLLTEDLLQYVDYLTPNLTELRTLTGQTEGEAAELLRSLKAKTSCRIIVTLGEEGVLYIDQHDQEISVPSHSIEVIDTTGAGDAFNAGLAFALSLDKPLDEAVRFANATAALSVTKHGAQNGMPNLDEVEKLLLAR